MFYQPQCISSVLSRAKQTMQDEFKSTPKIQRVSPHLREGDKYTKYYKPKLISIGPIHHGDSNLKRGEKYKLMWAAMFVEQNGQDPEVLHKKVLDKIPNLRDLFSWDQIGIPYHQYNNEELAFMLFVDGCSVIQILLKGNLIEPENLNIKLDQMILVRRDLLLLENQLPYEVLKLLVDDEMKLKMPMCYFCISQNMFTFLGSTNSFFSSKDDIDRQHQMIEQYFPSIHLLDYLRKIILNDGTLAEQQVDQKKQVDEQTLEEQQVDQEIQVDQQSLEEQRQIRMKEDLYSVVGPEYMPMVYNWCYEFEGKRTTYRSIRELKGGAIRMKKQLNVDLRNISFSSSCFGGKLKLPPLILDESTVPTLMNLVAYEMCLDFQNKYEISSYVKLLDLLIDHPEDVKELREAEILQNSMGSDEEVSKLFNTIGSELVQNKALYYGVKNEIEKHYKKKVSIWIAEAYYTHFRSPWTIIALLAATALLILTSIQTWKAF